MRVKIYYQYGSLNSKPVFDAVKQGCERLGHTIVDSQENLAVIWSVLWMGRMQANQAVYEQCLKKNIPVLIVEVGNLRRNHTWRLSLENINGLGYFANDTEIDSHRAKKLGVTLRDPDLERNQHIVLACQHKRSLQWKNMPATEQWVQESVAAIRKYTDRKIIVRPHPRNLIRLSLPGVEVQLPKKIKDSYDNFDIDYNCYCLVNYNSGPAVQAAIFGTPVICDQSSLAYPVSDVIENINQPTLPDRQQWFDKLCYTEWTVDEIQQGIPLVRLLSKM